MVRVPHTLGFVLRLVVRMQPESSETGILFSCIPWTQNPNFHDVSGWSALALLQTLAMVCCHGLFDWAVTGTVADAGPGGVPNQLRGRYSSKRGSIHHRGPLQFLQLPLTQFPIHAWCPGARRAPMSASTLVGTHVRLLLHLPSASRLSACCPRAVASANANLIYSYPDPPRVLRCVRCLFYPGYLMP